MSHMVKMGKAQIKDLEALRRTARRMGMTLHEDRKEAVYYSGQKCKCDMVLSHPQAKYEIAVHRRNENGEPVFEMEADLYDGSLRKIVGDECGTLCQIYGIEAVKKEAEARGYETAEEWDSNKENCRVMITGNFSNNSGY